MEEDLVNAESRMPQDQYRRTDQTVRNRNHSILARGGDELSLQAGWRSQHAADDDAAANHDWPRQIRCPYGREQVGERRRRANENRSSHRILVGREGERRELGQRYGRLGKQGRDQLSERLCIAGRHARFRLNPHRLQNETGQLRGLPLSVK
jgi:hypothetical protein